MKNFTLFFILSFSIQSWSQSDQKMWLQKNKYDLAISYFDKNEFGAAADLFLFAYKIKPDSELGKISKNKFDSLKPVVRKKLIDKLVGTWKMNGNIPSWSQRNLKSDKAENELMIIDPDKISYYLQNNSTKEMKLIKTEEIIFYDSFEKNNHVKEILTSDMRLWSYYIDEYSKNLRAINTGRVTATGKTKIDLDNEEMYYERIN
ncbi:hypothetical protein OIU80_14255 [Flavobacterium sp. LS1R47]|jgi:hypothetical protein|uniref:Uncharacterized protein n=1 Tax=Flavobacterium frigoritolerans TaxID=2987686 RepID=A0A9X3C8W6_9FLAO|nr:hypothetical protein [Flavobacterium frigoritolerans]MCV9933448.1 hypothetical protein [Flavobacterium frigoritolerans]